MNKLALIGTGNSKLEAPFGEDGWDFWGVNNLFQYVPFKGWSKWFDLHKFSIDTATGLPLRKGEKVFRTLLVGQYLNYLNELNIPVYMREDCQILSNSVEYPMREVIAKLGYYFSSTNAWMIGLAIISGYETIGIFGFDMMTGEYASQRPCAEYLIGYARGKGIEVILPTTCPLCKCDRLYGLDD